jgi:hypothetical protein
MVCQLQMGRTNVGTMKKASILIALFLMASPLYADAILYTKEADFLRVLETPFFLENFGSYTPGGYTAQSLTLDQNGYRVVLSASRRLYSLSGSISTNVDYDTLKIDFTNSPSPVTAVGGFFWPTDLPGNNIAGPIKLVLSDGAEYMLDNASYGDFVGLTLIDGTTFQYLEVSTLVGRNWPTVDHLYVGNDPPIPTPEPSSWIFFTAGICGMGIIIGMTILRRRSSLHSQQDGRTHAGQ